MASCIWYQEFGGFQPHSRQVLVTVFRCMGTCIGGATPGPGSKVGHEEWTLQAVQ